MTAILDAPIQEKDWHTTVSNLKGALFPQAQSAGVMPEGGGVWHPAIQKIVTFQDLHDDWDGQGAKAPDLALLESSVGLAYLLAGRGMPPPDRVVPGLEGSVIMEWQEPGGTYREIEIVERFFAEVMVLEPGKPARHWTLPDK